MALAGFKRDDLTVEKHGARLVIQGKMDGVEKIPHYIHQGLRHKTFDLSFTLADHLQVDGASFKEGLLQINLVREIPKALLPQKIAITAAS